MSQPPIVPGAPTTAAAPTTPPPASSRPNWVVPTIVALVVLLLAAGASVAYLAGRPSAPAASEPSQPTATPTPTRQTATIGQYAGIVNESAVDLRESYAIYRDCSLDDPITATCRLHMFALQIQAQTLVVKLQGAAKPGVPAFIGAPPAELEDLVADTSAAAQRLDDTVDDPATAHPGEVYMAASALISVLDRWEPYI